VVVKKSAAFNLTGNFAGVMLTATSTANAMTYPDIDGDRTVSDAAEIHFEKYSPQRNALIPKMFSNISGERSGFTIAHIPNDTAEELNAEYDTSSYPVYASFAITSETDIVTIDAGEAVVLDKVEIRGRNIRRLIASGIYKGGAAVA
jgi:hypothetical protein